jgi:hypothetical protein
MDNSVDLPGYKYYVDPEGRRPDVKVTFVNIVEAEGTIHGTVIEADPGELDARERNYERREVEPGLWAYVGTAEARARFEEGPAVVSREYLALVPGGEPPGVPIWDLRRVDLD